MALGYGGALAVTIDQSGERGPPQRFQAELYEQDIRHDRHGATFRQLHIAPWGTQPASEIDVDLATYDAVSEGENVCPLSYRGWLGIGSFRIAPCPPALLAVTHHGQRPVEWQRSDLVVIPALMLGALGFLVWSGGIADGEIHGRTSTYTRRGEPIFFWFHVVLLGGMGAMMLVVAVAEGLALL